MCLLPTRPLANHPAASRHANGSRRDGESAETTEETAKERTDGGLQSGAEARPAACSTALREGELRRGEASFRAIFEHAGNGLAIAALDGRLLRCNPRLCDMLGYSAEELTRLTVEQVSQPDEYKLVRQHWPRMISGEINRYQMERRLRRKSGDFIWTWLTATIVRDPMGGPEFIIAMIEDIAARKVAQEELQLATERLHSLVGRLNSMREEEAKRIARELHDNLGQHLTALNLELDRLERRIPDPTSELRSEFERLHGVVDESIEVVQKIAGDLRHARLELLGLTAAMEWKVQKFSRVIGVPVRFLHPAEIPPVAETIGIALLRILQEALTNVARHAGASEVVVRLEDAKGQVMLTVEDNGRGITSAQISDARSIGLVGMHERAHLAGGNLAISANPAGGTTVRVSIPYSTPMSR